MAKAAGAFRTISEVAETLGVQPHVIRFWETKFNQIKPVKRAGGRRYYRPADLNLLCGIRTLLHDEGMTIKGVQKMLREEGVAAVSARAAVAEMPSAADTLDDASAEEEEDVIEGVATEAEPTVEEGDADPEMPPADAPIDFGVEGHSPDVSDGADHPGEDLAADPIAHAVTSDDGSRPRAGLFAGGLHTGAPADGPDRFANLLAALPADPGDADDVPLPRPRPRRPHWRRFRELDRPAIRRVAARMEDLREKMGG